MGAAKDILGSIDTRQLASALGTDEATARQAAAAAIPTLINGLQANVGSADGAAGLLGALGQHADTGLYGDTVDLDAVDTADGQKIVAHALAGDPGRLQAVSGLSGNLLSKLLPLLAPIVMSYLANKLGMGGTTQGSGSGSGDILGDLLGGLLGGASGGASSGGLGDLLGQILGGAQAGTSAVPSGYGGGPQAGADGDLGGVFNSPGGDSGLQIPTGSDAAPTQQQGSGDILGDLLGQILAAERAPGLVLASASPARFETLTSAGLSPRVVVSDVDEDAYTASGVPALVAALARAKAEAVAASLAASEPSADLLVVGCDSLLELDGEPLGKPGSSEQAVQRWRRMRGRTGHLHTGHHVVRLGPRAGTASGTATTGVAFADLADAEIDAYVATGEPLRVAGAFTIDGLGGAYVRGVEGDPHAVVGISLPLLRDLFAQLGVAWHTLWAPDALTGLSGSGDAPTCAEPDPAATGAANRGTNASLGEL